jgi:hypothetical protein
MTNVFPESLQFYHSNLVTPCGAGVLHDMDPNKDVRDLSVGACDTQDR